MSNRREDFVEGFDEEGESGDSGKNSTETGILKPVNATNQKNPVELHSITVAGKRIDVSVYAHKKTLAQGMMDIALLTANANQLRYVYEMGSMHPYFYPSLVLIKMSIILQVAVGVGLLINSQYNIKKDPDMQKANRIHNFTMICIFLITILNVFISAFGVGVSGSVKFMQIQDVGSNYTAIPK